MASIRQPIVSVLGHVDDGKAALLDRIRITGVAGGEAGGITQHIGATEVPLAAILEMCGDLVKGRSFRIPGLLFIDTPGHVAFATLRARGGALSDLAVLVIDINEGSRPQTIESLNILKRYKPPFVVAANKIDLVPGWRKHEGKPFVASYEDQPVSARDELDKRMYELVGRLYEHGFSAERYDRVADFTTNIAVVPVSAKFGEGIPDLLLMLIGLAQRFLEQQLATTDGPAVGTILEVKEEKGLGITLDAIVYEGTLSKGDTIVFGTAGKPGTTKVKALLKPKPLDEIRDPQERFDSVKTVSAAAGVKLVGSGLEKAVAGAPIHAAKGNVAAVIVEVAKESQVHIETQDEGILVKADAIGSLEGLAYPAKLLFLGEYVFRTSKPAIFGVRVLAGRIRPGESIMRADGRALGRIKTIRSGEKTLEGANQGQEVAISVDGITIGRQINGGDVLYVDLPEADARALRGRTDLTHDELAALDEICAIKRKEDPFWGM